MTFKKLLESKNITQVELARELGLSQSAISLYTSGKRAPRILLLPRIAEALGCTMEELLKCLADGKEVDQ